MRRVWLLLAAGLIGGIGRAEAQLERLTVPSGAVRIELGGDFRAFDRRFFDGTLQDYGADFTAAPLGSAFFPALADAEARLAQASGISDYRMAVGSTTGRAQASLGTGVIGLSLGLTDRLTLFGRAPFVRQRAEAQVLFDSAGANVGYNPSHPTFGTTAGQAQNATFFAGFDAALSSLAAQLAAGAYDGDPARRALAQATLADGSALRDLLRDAVSEPGTLSLFLPLSTSAAGGALSNAISTLQTTLSGSLGVSGFTASLALPASPLEPDDFAALVAAPSGPIAARLGPSELFLLGDVEVGATYALLDRWDRKGNPGGIRAAVQLLVRLPTGTRARPDALLGLGTGERQTDVGAGLVVDPGSRRWGTRLTASYTRQLASTELRRIARPSQPIPFANRLAAVRRDPGDVLRAGLQPFVRLTPTLAFTLGVEHWRRSSDEVLYLTATDSIPGVPASELAVDSRASATVVRTGLSYASRGVARGASVGWPVEASWIYERAVEANGGRVPHADAVRAEIRMYLGIW